MSRSSHFHHVILWKQRLLIKPYQPDREHNRQLLRYTDMTRHCTVLWCSDSSFLVAMAIKQIVYCNNLKRILHSRSRLHNRNHLGHYYSTLISNTRCRASQALCDSIIPTVGSGGFWLLMYAASSCLMRDGCGRKRFAAGLSAHPVRNASSSGSQDTVFS